MKSVYVAGMIGLLTIIILGIFVISSKDHNVRSALGLCNVNAYTLYGDLVTAGTRLPVSDSGNGDASAAMYTVSDDLVSGIDASEKDPNIKAIVLEVDSPGGLPVAGEEVANALRTTSKPTVVLIRNAGLSAAYWAATGGDMIFASKNSEVGSIGVLLAYIDQAKKNEKDGITYNSVVSGKFKDLGNPNKSLTTEERALLQRDVNIIQDNFIQAVSTNRKLSKDDVAMIGDGSSVLGERALRLGLIDRIGDFKDVEKYLNDQIGEEINICWNAY